MSKVSEVKQAAERLEWNDDIADILGRPCFACVHLAEILRRDGVSIPHKAEYEQAHVLFWTLNKYLEHGSKWRDACKEDIERIKANELAETNQ